MITEKNYIMDGEMNGFCLKRKNANAIIKINGINRFKSMAVLNAACEQQKINVDDFDLGVVVEGKHFIDMKYLQQREEWYELWGNPDGTTMLSTFSPQIEEKLVKIGYIVFGDDYYSRIEDKEAGKKLNDKYFSAIQAELGKLLLSGSFKGEDQDERGLNYYTMHGSTFKLRFIRNTILVNINEGRKLVNSPVLPFIKDIDRYKSVYFVVTKEVQDLIDNKVVYAAGTSVLDRIVNDLSESLGIKVGIELCKFRQFSLF